MPPSRPVSSERGLLDYLRLPGLDPEATPLVGLGLGLTGLIFGLKPRFAAWPLALTAAAAMLFRDPSRSTPDLPRAVFAPADGLVASVNEVYEHHYLHTDAQRLSIQVGPLDVPVLRSPGSGQVRFLNELAPNQPLGWSASAEPERGACLLIGIDTEYAPLLLAISASPLIRRPQSRLEQGDRLTAGMRLATARLGARVDLLVPSDAIIDLPATGAFVTAGVTAVGRFA